MTSQAAESEPCAFCAIARGEDRTIEIVCEDESWTAFFPLEPATPGHTLVIPRTHVSDLWAASAPSHSRADDRRPPRRRRDQRSHQPRGHERHYVRGEGSRTDRLPLHLHVVPRWKQDGFGRIWPIEGSKYENADLENVAELIRAECQRKRREA
jgi:histidine triad (HIT) family protein